MVTSMMCFPFHSSKSEGKKLILFILFSAILGFHGMLNQVQYHQAFVENKSNDEAGGFQGE